MHVTTISLTLGFFRGQARALRDAGWEVHGVSGAGPILGIVPDGVDFPHHVVPMRRRIEPGRDAVAVARLVRLFRRLKPDIVHAHTPKGGLLGLTAAAVARVPVRVYTIHGWPAETATGPRRHALLAAERVSCRLAHRVWCVSPSLVGRVVADGCAARGVPQVLGQGSVDGVDARGAFDPDAIPTDRVVALRARWAIPEGARVIGFVGRFTRDKGVVELLAAWRSLRSRYPDAWLVALGPVLPDEDLPPEVLSAFQQDPRVVLPGMVDGIAPWYALMDVLALPTWREGFGVVALEAAAMRVPVVACRVTGIVDAVADGTGTLVPVRDEAALAAAIARYLDDPALAAAHGAAARARVLADFEPATLRAALLADYQSLVEGNR